MSEVKRVKPQNPKGTRDFLPAEVAKRNYLFGIIKSVFAKYGFEQIETPAMERLETLTGKYGEEGDNLLFKILNSGDFLKDAPAAELADRNSKSLTKHIAEKGLRYDLTVPLARFVVQHQDKIAFPFKRYHLGPVWRADRPQKGRYQEFYQCDADIIGSTSLLNEVELTQIYIEVFEQLGINVEVQVNNRKVLLGIAAYFGCLETFEDFVTIIDKLDKIGYQGVEEEFRKIGIDVNHPHRYPLSLFREGVEQNADSWGELIAQLSMSLHESGLAVVDEGLRELSRLVNFFPFKKQLRFNPFLVRGLNYYTGTIWEVTAKNASIGSIGGGGRYDNLTELFGGQNMSGVGISFGVERIFDIMEELNLFPAGVQNSAKILFVPRETAVEDFTFGLVQQVRAAGVAAEIFLGNVKKQKQYGYAEQKGILFISEVGGDEMTGGLLRVKNTQTREEQRVDIQSLIALLK